MIHLTNDAIQKKDDDYGKFENSNKLSYDDFQRYIDTNYPDKNINFMEAVLPKAKEIIRDTVKAVLKRQVILNNYLILVYLRSLFVVYGLLAII